MIGSSLMSRPSCENCESRSWFADVPPAMTVSSRTQSCLGGLTAVEAENKRMCAVRGIVSAREVEEVGPARGECPVYPTGRVELEAGAVGAAGRGIGPCRDTSEEGENDG